MANRGGPLERDTIRDLILPVIRDAGWTNEQITREYRLKAERVMSLGGISRNLGDGYADIVLEATPGTPVVVIEAKRQYSTAQDAIQQAVRYAQQLDVPLAYGTNGHEIIERNLRTGSERKVSAIAAPALAWSEYQQFHGLTDEGARLISQPLNRRRRNVSGDVVTPRYYQTVAINRVLTAIATGHQRILLLMATGTGKTFTAMQIVSKLREYERLIHPEKNYRVLYLADRDQLLKQPMGKDFTEAFGADPLCRILGKADTSREIYFASYQALTGGNPDAGEALGDDALLFSGFRPDFFDLVIVDECHRGSAQEDSSWRKVLNYFTSAVQLGLTATPLQVKQPGSHGPSPVCLPGCEQPAFRQISYEYFGNPVFTYSLKDGIADGYLAPYKVRRVVLTPDAEGWQPTPGEVDRYGREIPSGTYSTPDFEKIVSLLARTKVAAHHLSTTLRKDPTARAIVFCVDIEHASDMRRALIAENPDLVAKDPEWVVRIVGVEDEKERLLDDFTDPEAVSPVVATTSRLLSTGIDVQDLKFVVLFRPVGSMIEFKQIIGRGSRLYPDKYKYEFEIIDYVGANHLFEDPDFDGYPNAITVEHIDTSGNTVDTTTEPTRGEFGSGPEPIDPNVNEPEPPFTVTDPPPPPHPPPPPRRKYYVDTDDGTMTVESEARLVPTTAGGHLVLTEYAQYVRDRIREVGSDADTLRRTWANAGSRHKLLAMLEGDDLDLAEMVEAVGVPGVDPLDALFHLAWDMPAQTRAQRARRARDAHATELAAMTEQARDILEGLLQRYETYGVDDIETPNVFLLDPLSRLGSPTELAQAAGSAENLRNQLDLVQTWLYA